VPAWRTIPSGYLVGTRDSVIPAAQQRFMAQRAGDRIVEINASTCLWSPTRARSVLSSSRRPAATGSGADARVEVHAAQHGPQPLLCIPWRPQ
jgi:hypothetical protein